MLNYKSYYAIIPAVVRYDDRLSPNCKLLYGEITALSNEKGFCWATNEYFAKLYNVSKQSISSWISQLKKYNYITSEIIYKEGSKEILHRYIRLFDYASNNNLNTPIQNNLKVNNKIINNTTNNQSIYQDELSREKYQKIIYQNIDYDIICNVFDKKMLDELVEIMLDAVSTTSEEIRVGKQNYSSNVVRGRLLKIDSSHIEYVIDCINKNTTKISNIKNYILTSLYNAPATFEHFYSCSAKNGLYGNQ